MPKNSPKFELEPETALQKVENAPWETCPHTYSLKIIELMGFTEDVLQDWIGTVHPGNLSPGERRVLHRAAGLLHDTLLALGSLTKPEDRTDTLN